MTYGTLSLSAGQAPFAVKISFIFSRFSRPVIPFSNFCVYIRTCAYMLAFIYIPSTYAGKRTRTCATISCLIHRMLKCTTTCMINNATNIQRTSTNKHSRTRNPSSKHITLRIGLYTQNKPPVCGINIRTVISLVVCAHHLITAQSENLSSRHLPYQASPKVEIRFSSPCWP